MMLRKKRGFSSCAPPPLNSRTTLDLSICTTNAAVVHPHVTQRGPLASPTALFVTSYKDKKAIYMHHYGVSRNYVTAGTEGASTVA